MSASKIDFVKMREALDKLNQSLDATQQACQQEWTEEALKERVAELAGQQLDIIDAALAHLDIPTAPTKQIDPYSEAVAAIEAAKEQEQLLVAQQHELEAATSQLDKDTEAQPAAGGVASTTITSAAIQAALAEVASKKAAARDAAAAAAADLAATATREVQGLLATAAELDADYASLRMHDPKLSHLGAASASKMSEHPFLPMAAAPPLPGAWWTKWSPASTTAFVDNADLDLAADVDCTWQALQERQDKVFHRLGLQSAQLNVLVEQLLSQADDDDDDDV